MIPIRDTVRARSFPITTLLIVALNVYVFFVELSQGPLLEHFARQWALTPAVFTGWVRHGGSPLDSARYVPIFTSMFLHAGWIHIIGNMLYLWVFGGHVEDVLGHGRFLLFYLACGLVAGLAQVRVEPALSEPVLGASGAIAGVLGGYLLLFPRARILTLIPIFIFPWFVEIPAVLFLGVWFLMQLLNGTAELGIRTAQSQGVAWWAHAGGFLTGFLLVFVLPRRRPRRRLAPGY